MYVRETKFSVICLPTILITLSGCGVYGTAKSSNGGFDKPTTIETAEILAPTSIDFASATTPYRSSGVIVGYNLYFLITLKIPNDSSYVRPFNLDLSLLLATLEPGVGLRCFANYFYGGADYGDINCPNNPFEEPPNQNLTIETCDSNNPADVSDLPGYHDCIHWTRSNQSNELIAHIAVKSYDTAQGNSFSAYLSGGPPVAITESIPVTNEQRPNLITTLKAFYKTRKNDLIDRETDLNITFDLGSGGGGGPWDPSYNSCPNGLPGVSGSLGGFNTPTSNGGTSGQGAVMQVQVSEVTQPCVDLW